MLPENKGRKMSDINVKVEIKPGSTTSTQKKAWDSFWQRLIGQAKESPERETNNDKTYQDKT